jgi:hypothetical protein
MSSWTSTTCKTKNWPNYNLSLKRRGSLPIWFGTEMAWEAKPSGKRGRQHVYSDAAIQTCLTFKVLFGLPLRQATGFCGKPDGTCRVGLGCARLQHLVSTTA